MAATLHELRVAAGAGDELVAELMDAGCGYTSPEYAEAIAIAQSNHNTSVEERQMLAFRCAVVARHLLYGLLREAETNVETDLGKSGRHVPPAR